MSDTQTVERARPDLTDEPVSDSTGDHIVIVFDNDHNTWDEVIGILQKATGCSLEEAANEVHRADALRQAAADANATFEIDETLARLVDHAMALFRFLAES